MVLLLGAWFLARLNICLEAHFLRIFQKLAFSIDREAASLNSFFSSISRVHGSLNQESRRQLQLYILLVEYSLELHHSLPTDYFWSGLQKSEFLFSTAISFSAFSAIWVYLLVEVRQI